MIDGYTLEVAAQRERVEAEQRAARARFVDSAHEAGERAPLGGAGRRLVGATMARVQRARRFGRPRWGTAPAR